MWTRAELKENAKRFFKFNYWKMVVASIVLTIAVGGIKASSGSRVSDAMKNSDGYGMLTAGVSMLLLVVALLAILVNVFALKPLEVGGRRFFVVSHYQKAELGELGYGFTNSYGNVVVTMFLRELFTVLWSLLLIVPGIVKAYEYRMIPFILAENPEISYKDAFAMSKRMMDGNKMDTFILDLSFFGWYLLTGITCGIAGLFYVNPYKYMTDAELYVALKEITFGNGQPTGYQNGTEYDNSIYVQNNNQ